MTLNDVIVTIRVPESLANELKSLAKKKHFLDISEQVRTIVRNKWIMHTQPELHSLKSIREDIKEAVNKRVSRKIEQEVLKELEKIKKQLSEEVLLR